MAAHLQQPVLIYGYLAVVLCLDSWYAAQSSLHKLVRVAGADGILMRARVAQQMMGYCDVQLSHIASTCQVHLHLQTASYLHTEL